MTEISSKAYGFLAHLSHPMIVRVQKKSSPSKLGNSFLHSAIADITISLLTFCEREKPEIKGFVDTSVAYAF